MAVVTACDGQAFPARLSQNSCHSFCYLDAPWARWAGLPERTERSEPTPNASLPRLAAEHHHRRVGAATYESRPGGSGGAGRFAGASVALSPLLFGD